MRAVLMISHGSRYPKTLEEVKSTVKAIGEKVEIPIMEYAFLELESPSIPEGIDRCVERGADEILILLNFLNSGRHVDQDIPQIVCEAQYKHPHVAMMISRPLAHHSKIIDLFADIIKNP